MLSSEGYLLKTKQTTYVPTLSTKKITCIVFMHILNGSSEAMEGELVSLITCCCSKSRGDHQKNG